jgi:signal peptidase I
MTDDQSLPQLDSDSQNEKASHSSVRRVLFDIAETLILALVLYFGIDAISARVRVQNVSMQPTLYEGEFVLVSKMAYRLGHPKIGDIVVFHAPTEPGEDFIKRIIGLPGNLVKVQNGKVFVDGYRLNEDYLAASPDYQGEWIVPEDSLFVLGDNRNQSSDSHRWGFVPVDSVVGRAVFVYWPIDKFTVLEHPNIVSADRQ